MPRIETVTPDQSLPASADVVVIGAGIAGIATALELAEAGQNVVVVEKGEVAAEQSSRNWGWCRQMGRDARELPLILESMRLWRGMNERLGAETGFRTSGIAYLASDAEKAAHLEHWLEAHAKPAGIDSRMLSGPALDAAVPGASLRFAAGLYTASDGKAEPFLAVPAMARALQRRGGKVFTQTAARGIETSAGKVSAVVTERGSIACGAALLAGGYWSRHFLGNLGIAFPQLGVMSSVMRSMPLENGHSTTFSAGKFTTRKRLDGGFTITHNLSDAGLTPAHFTYLRDFWPMLKLEWRGFRFRVGRDFIMEARLKKRWRLDEQSPFEQLRILDPVPSQRLLEEALTELKAHFPAFMPLQMVESWGGMIDALPDAVPVIAPVLAQPGLYIASGFSGHGFGLGPGAGKLMAEIIMGKSPCVDPSPFRFERFSDGSKPTAITSL